MKHKKLICILLTIVIAATAAACSKPEPAPKPDPDPTPDFAPGIEKPDDKNADEAYDINADLKTLASSHKGYNLTREDSEKLFDIAREYRLDNIRMEMSGENKLEEPEPLISFQHYVATVFDGKYVHRNKEERAFVLGKYVKEIAEKYYGFTYDIADDDELLLPIEGSSGPPLMDVIRYETENTPDGIKVTLIARDADAFGFWGSPRAEQEAMVFEPDKYSEDPSSAYYYKDGAENRVKFIEYMLKNKLTSPFQASRELIVSGRGDELYGTTGSAYRISYLSDDGYTPKKFLSYECYGGGWK